MAVLVYRLIEPHRPDAPGGWAWLSEMPVSPWANALPAAAEPDVITRRPGCRRGRWTGDKPTRCVRVSLTNAPCTAVVQRGVPVAQSYPRRLAW